MQNFLALIPARSGSKGLKDKNFLNFNKKPLIYWTIIESLKSKYISDVIVSSDSKIPGESTKVISLSKIIAVFFFKSLVYPGTLFTKANFFFSNALKSEDFPTLGLPTIITVLLVILTKDI